MSNVISFLTKHYLILDLISLLLIFALIGYFVEKKKQKESPFKIASDKYNSEKINLEQMHDQVTNNVSLSEMVNKNATSKKENNNQTNNIQTL